MNNIEQLIKFRDRLKEYQEIFKKDKEYTVGLAFDDSVINKGQKLREELNETWGELESTIIELWGERPKQTQFNSVFPVFETALSGNLESPLIGGAIESAIQVVIKCIGKAKSKPEADKYTTEHKEAVRRKKTIGILNKGRFNKFINNKFFGLDIGIQDEGEETFASGNKFSDSKSAPIIKKIEIIGRDKIEQHGGKNKTLIEKKMEKKVF